MADTPRPRSLTPILAQLGLVALLLVLPFIAPPDGRERASIAQFFGRFHPVLVHLPIGLLLLVPVLEIGGLLHVWRHLQKTAGFVLTLATIGAVVATAVGWLLAWSGGYEGETIMDHLWGGVWLSAACIVLTWFRHGYMAGEGYLFIRLGYMPLLFAFSRSCTTGCRPALIAIQGCSTSCGQHQSSVTERSASAHSASNPASERASRPSAGT